MGGQALNIDTRRFNIKEYQTISSEISIKLKCGDVKHFITTSYSNKKDFGDLDVLISEKSFVDSDEMYDFIVNNFDIKEISRNKAVISFEFREFQIDFILIPEKDWVTSKVYYSYNDLGNLMGRIANNMGFRYGHFGLEYRYNSSHGGKPLKISVSRDPKKIFGFLGFDFNQYIKGFDRLEDIFNYVIFSRYFTTMIFQYSMLNHQNKTRNKKRANYKKFLDYISDDNITRPINSEFPNLDFIGEAEKYFNVNIKSNVKEFELNILEKKRNDFTIQRLNQEIIKEHFDIKGKELGNAIKVFKKQVEKEFDMKWEQFVNSNDEDVVMKFFCKYNNFYNKAKKEWLKY